MSLDDSMNDRQSKSDALAFLFGAKEWREKLVQILFGNTESSVADVDSNGIAK